MIDLTTLNIPSWVHWLAQDYSGAWWGYQVEPLQNHHGWYENEVGNIIKLMDAESNSNWQTSLIQLNDGQR